MEEKHVGKERN
ncbi:Protein of unknown function [Lactobacillus delbrueckii subsp. lactis]|nr:Putative uncharacterized protein [Lactobacillus delbrueckii subsp. lactis]CDR84137.1 Protein of unknown function [Lactobacillus delbrueckii subsp. lactis]